LRQAIDNAPLEKIKLTKSEPANSNQPEERPKPRFRTLADFIAEYEPVSEVVFELLSTGSLYTMTAKTGVGKTAWLVSTALPTAAVRRSTRSTAISRSPASRAA
jgi:hypothetical protein